MADRKPATQKPAASKKLKALHRDKNISLKEFVRTSTDKEVRAIADNWFFNKKANFSNPPKKIGNTGRKKGSGGKKPAPTTSK